MKMIRLVVLLGSLVGGVAEKTTSANVTGLKMVQKKSIRNF
jgi:hypothetical protein